MPRNGSPAATQTASCIAKGLLPSPLSPPKTLMLGCGKKPSTNSICFSEEEGALCARIGLDSRHLLLFGSRFSVSVQGWTVDIFFSSSFSIAKRRSLFLRQNCFGLSQQDGFSVLELNFERAVKAIPLQLVEHFSYFITHVFTSCWSSHATRLAALAFTPLSAISRRRAIVRLRARACPASDPMRPLSGLIAAPSPSC